MVSTVDLIRDSDASQQSRLRLTRNLMHLCGADYAASFAWDNGKHCYVDAAFENMDADNINRYNQYFQFHNPLTNTLSQFRRAVAVSEVLPHRLLARTEFFNDFLQRDGLTYGINLFVHLGNRQIIDFRLWRSKKRQDFEAKQLKLLDSLIPSLRQISKYKGKRDLTEKVNFTQRESEVIDNIKAGLSDKQIANFLNISVTTLRTHIRKVYQKAQVHSRTELLSKLN